MADRVAGASPVSPGIVLTLGLLSATAPLSRDAYLPALPAIAAEFGVSAHARGRAATSLYSQLAAVAGAAPVLAPIAGGLIITVAGWRVVFVVLAALGIVKCRVW